MAAPERSLQTVAWQIFLNFIGTLIATLILTPTVFKSGWVGVGFGLIIFSSGTYVLFKVNERLLKLLWSGWTAGCYYTFPVEQNPKIWAEINHSFKYLGISGNSIVESFRDWIQKIPVSSTTEFQFLLMNPEGKAIGEQEAHKLGLPSGDVAVAHEVEIARGIIRTTILQLKGLELYQKQKLKIRLYDEFIPWWFYIFDSRKAYVGILEKGKSGRESPVLILKKNDRFASAFDAFEMTWERMWGQAKDA